MPPDTRETITWDDDSHERRTCLGAVVTCPRCGKTVGLVCETEAWEQMAGDGRWHHGGYGPAQGVCCGLLFVDSWDGCSTYDLGSATP
jgi:hypothetical protein